MHRPRAGNHPGIPRVQLQPPATIQSNSRWPYPQNVWESKEGLTVAMQLSGSLEFYWEKNNNSYLLSFLTTCQELNCSKCSFDSIILMGA